MSSEATHETRPKVFGIGFHKTATTSLADALEILGYRVTGPNGIDNPRIGEEAMDLAMELVPAFDAFQDNPWPILYRELDERFPGSKFILTLRPTDQWIRSIVRHFGNQTTPMREWIYGGHGDPVGHEQIYVDRYERHNQEVTDHFKDRPQDFMVMDITCNEGWDRLCRFLDQPIPERPFPHSNQARDRETRNPITRIYRKVARHLSRARK